MNTPTKVSIVPITSPFIIIPACTIGTFSISSAGRVNATAIDARREAPMQKNLRLASGKESGFIVRVAYQSTTYFSISALIFIVLIIPARSDSSSFIVIYLIVSVISGIILYSSAFTLLLVVSNSIAMLSACFSICAN